MNSTTIEVGTREAPRPSTAQRAIRGGAEGAAIGFGVAVLRSGIKLYRKGLPEDLASHVPEIVGYFVAMTVGAGYVFAMGRALAQRVGGSLAGTAVFAICGTLAGSRLGYDASAAPYPIFLGTCIGVLLGAPVGALIQRGFTRRSGKSQAAMTESAERW